MLIMGAMSEGTPTRFSDLLYGIEGISQKMLTKNLRALEHDGIISRLVGERGEEPRLVGRVGFVGQLLGAQSGTDRREQAEGFVGVGVSRQLALPRGGGQVCPGLLDEVLGEGVGARAWLEAGNGSPEQQRCQATPRWGRCVHARRNSPDALRHAVLVAARQHGSVRGRWTLRRWRRRCQAGFRTAWRR
ncbi:MAG: winged helix-turn-helix transcriptional regulator [Propionicimonas sp.]